MMMQRVFSGFAQGRCKQKHVYRCGMSILWQVKIICPFLSKINGIFSPQIQGYIFLLFNTYSSMLSKYILEFNGINSGGNYSTLLVLFLDVVGKDTEE